MLDVVTFHLSGAYLLAGLGLPLFHMLAMALSAARPSRPAAASAWQRRARRLLAPWLFWSLTILLLRLGTQVAQGAPLAEGLSPRMLLYGASIHLWFLPFSVVSTSLAETAALRAGEPRREAPRLFALVALACVLLPLPLLGSLGWPFDQWLFSLPACLLGYVAGRLMDERHVAWRIAGLVGTAALLTALCLGTAAATPRLAAHLARFALAFLALGLASLLPDAADRFTPGVTPLLLGVYIVHPVIFEYVLNDILWRHGLGRSALARVGAGLVCSFALVALLRKSPLRRFV